MTSGFTSVKDTGHQNQKISFLSTTENLVEQA
jgi:hypothetical protein